MLPQTIAVNSPIQNARISHRTTAAGPKMPPALLVPLLVMVVAFTLLYLTLHLVAMRTEILKRRVATLTRQAAARSAT